MAKIESLGSFLTGHEEIDRDHQSLIDIVNEIEAAIRCGTGTNQRLLNSLVETVDSHFRSEEAILRNISYPDSRRHAQYHADSFARAAALRDACEVASDNRDWEESFRELRGLVINEIVMDDIEFKGYLQNKMR